MLDRGTGYAPQAADGYTSNYPSSTERLEDNSSYHQRQWGSSMTVQPYLEGGNPWADQNPMGVIPQTELPDEVSQYHRDFAGRSDAQNYGHLDANMSWTPSVAEHSREGARVDDERLQWTSPSIHASLGEVDNSNNDDGAEDFDEYDEVSGTYASDYVDSAKLLAPQPFFTTEHAMPPEGSDNVFSNGVLSREHGHEEALGPYTTRLLHRIEPLEHGFRSHAEAAMEDPTSSDPHNWPMQQYEIVGAPQPWQPLEGQQQMEVPGVGLTNNFQYEVTEDTPVVPHPTDFESGSM
jgi:hypothetical protein